MADRLSENGDELCITTKVQLTGVLLKRPFGHQSNKWSKRFFVVKEGFLLYYTENEKKVFEKRGYFNIHPKGVIPLGGCTVDPVIDGGQQFAIHVKSEEFNNQGYVALAAENHYEREKWIRILQEASRITWRNTQLGEALIRELESQGLQLCRERQDYFDRLQEETMALRDEIDKNEELERVTAELDMEKRKLEKMMQELREEHELIKREYEETVTATVNVQDDRIQLQQTTEDLQKALQELASEKERTLLALKQQEEENCKLSQTRDQLQGKLQSIEEDTKLILEEKEEIAHRYVENELRSQILAEEKKLISEHALNLQSSLQDLMAQKVLTEAELKEEILARIDAEKHLKSAEQSLNHLEKVLHMDGGCISQGIREEILPDVKRLKQFFEDVAEEAKIDANKPLIMKNAVLARKKIAQIARCQLIQTTRNEKARSLGIVLDNENVGGSTRTLRRSLSTLVSDGSTRRRSIQAQLTLRRSMSTRHSQQLAAKQQNCIDEKLQEEEGGGGDSSQKDTCSHSRDAATKNGVTEISESATNTDNDLVTTVNVDGTDVKIRRKVKSVD